MGGSAVLGSQKNYLNQLFDRFLHLGPHFQEVVASIWIQEMVLPTNNPLRLTTR